MPEKDPLKKYLKPVTGESDNTQVVKPFRDSKEELRANLLAKQNRDRQELLRRKQAIAASNSSKPFSKEGFANAAAGEKLRVFPNDPNSIFDEYINPAKMVGDMADNLGRAFTGGSTTDKLLAVGAPLLTGVLGGIGAKSTGQFVNNIVNPLAGLKGGLIDNLPAGKFPKEIVDDEPDWQPFIKKFMEDSLDFSEGTFKLPHDFVVKTPRDQFKSSVKKVVDLGDDEIEKNYDSLIKEYPNLDDKARGFLLTNRFRDKTKVIDKKTKWLDMTSNDGKMHDNFMGKQSPTTEYSPKENLLVNQYTKGYDNWFNNRSHNAAPDEIKPMMPALVDEFETLIKKNKFKDDMILHRGANQYTLPTVKNVSGGVRENVKLNQLEVGDIYEPDSFISTSFDENSSSMFGDIGMNIKVPGGGKQSFLYPNATGGSTMPSELEVILPKKLQYKVNAIREGSHPTSPIYDMSILNPYLKAGAVPAAGLLAKKKSE